MTHTRTQTLGLAFDERTAVPVPAELASAFGQVCETQLGKVHAYIRYRVSNADAAEELTADVFVRSLERLRTYDPTKGELIAWMFGIARNLVRDHLRTQRRWKWVPLLWINRRECVSPNPEAALAAAEVHRHLAAAIAALSDRERDVLGLRFGAGLTNREIAEISGLREAHVGVVVFRAVGRLRRQLALKGVRRGHQDGRTGL